MSEGIAQPWPVRHMGERMNSATLPSTIRDTESVVVNSTRPLPLSIKLSIISHYLIYKDLVSVIWELTRIVSLGLTMNNSLIVRQPIVCV